MRRPTIGESLFPDTTDFVALLTDWRRDAVVQLLGFVWNGYDLLASQMLEGVDPDQEYEDLERSVTQYLEPRIRRTMTGYEPYDIQHGAYEHETRSAAPAQPPQYDLAFVWYRNPRVMFPLEAKVLKTEGDVSAYLTDVRDEFLSCRYAPFSSEAAMLGYLLSGSPDRTFRAISEKLPCILHDHSDFQSRHHKVSDHQRDVPVGKLYPASFRLHHLVLVLMLN
jgi:hypothetical protein